MNVYQIMEEILNVVESSKEELVNKYVPNMKAERRHLDKETKKGKKLSKGLDMSADVSKEMKEIAQKDVDKAQDKEWGAQQDVISTEYGTPEHNVARVKYNKARQELKAANQELRDWTRDEHAAREKAGSVKKEAKEANKKRNELNRKIAALKGRSDVVTDKAFEALEIMEAIINEVSLKKWTETAKEVLPKREAELKDKEKTYMKSIGGNEENPKETWYKLTKGIGYPENKEYKEFKDSLERAKHAEKVSELNKGSGSASANKVITAANKVVDKRYEKEGNNNHAFRAATLGNEDPVKSKVWKRANEAFELMEQICDFADNLFELDYEEKQNISPNKISKVKKGKDGEKVEVVSVADELFPYEGDAKQQFNQKILAKINDMIEGTGSLEDLIQFVRRGVGNKKVAHEGLDEAKDAEGYKENMDIANHYDHLYSKEPANSPDGSPNPVAAEWKRKYQEYFDKAMKCHYGDENKSKKVSEAFSVMSDIVNTILERKNIFGHEEGNRGDLIDDVSQTVTGKTLNQHIENKVNKVVKPVKRVEEALDLMEDILSTINKSIHNPSKRKELTDRVKEIQGDKLASKKDVVKRGGKAATRKENGETIYTTDAPDYDRDRPKSKEKEELEVSKSHGIVPTNKERRRAEYEQAFKEANSIGRSMSKHYKKHNVNSETRGKNYDKFIEYIEKDWKSRKGN